MKALTRWSWLASAAVVSVMVVAGAVLSGCSSAPEKPSGAKKGETQKKVEPGTTSEEPTTKPEEPVEKPETPTTKPEEPTTKPEEPATKPEEPAKKPEEPTTKPEEPASEGSAGSFAAVKVSKFAPAEDLDNQVTDYVKNLGKSVASEEEYKDFKEKIVKDANALTVIALALGLHDQANKQKANAGLIIKASQDLAATKDFDAAKKGVAAVQAAAEAQGEKEDELKWEKVAALDQLMKQVPLVNTKLKRYLQGTRFKSKAKDSAGYAAVLAAIAQASVVDTSQAKDEGQVKQWQRFCVEMRDAAGAVNAAIHAGDQAAADAAVEKLGKTCDDCHQVFHPAALGKTDVEEK